MLLSTAEPVNVDEAAWRPMLLAALLALTFAETLLPVSDASAVIVEPDGGVMFSVTALLVTVADEPASVVFCADAETIVAVDVKLRLPSVPSLNSPGVAEV